MYSYTDRRLNLSREAFLKLIDCLQDDVVVEHSLVRKEGTGWDGVGWDGEGRKEMGLGRMGRGGMGRDGMRRDGTG